MEEQIENNLAVKQPNGFAVHIDGDKSAFVSKSAIDKFKLAVKSDGNFQLEDLVSKYIKPEYTINQVSIDINEVKFTISNKPIPIQTQYSSDIKQRLREKINQKQNARSSSSFKETKYTIGQSESSQIIKDVMKQIQEKRPAYRVIDITNILNPDTYVEYQKANYFTNIVMVAERTETNEAVFTPRSNSDKSNVIVMYQGSYRTFDYALVNLVLDSVVEIIKTK
jgi:hypothetical protein